MELTQEDYDFLQLDKNKKLGDSGDILIYNDNNAMIKTSLHRSTLLTRCYNLSTTHRPYNFPYHP